MQISISTPKSPEFVASVLSVVVEQGLKVGQDADAYADVTPLDAARVVEVTGPTGVTAVAVEAQAGGALGHWRGFLGYTSEGAAFAAEGLDDLVFVLEANGVNGEVPPGE